jgi:hypothetical protein
MMSSRDMASLSSTAAMVVRGGEGRGKEGVLGREEI